MMISGLHIEPTNICTLKCAGCARTRFINQWPRRWRNHSLDINELMEFIDIDISGLPVSLCGNYGDPIYHPQAIELFRAFKTRGARLQIITNGSYRNLDWWQETVELLDDDDQVVFSVDGTPENFAQYRVNGDWSSIRIGMDACVVGRCKTVWKYIPFRFNQDHIDLARSLSQEIGIQEFRVEPSDRFDNDTEHLIPVTDLLGVRKMSQDTWRQNETLDVEPKCHARDQHFISAAGYYSPCCFIADHRFYYKTQFGQDRSSYDIRNQRLTAILDQPAVIDFYGNIPKNPPRVCQYSCPKTG